jgi:hypothetical protein
MSHPVKSGADAVEIARKLALSAGVVFPQVFEAREKDGVWQVKIQSLGGEHYEANIAATSGAVTEWKKLVIKK